MVGYKLRKGGTKKTPAYSIHFPGGLAAAILKDNPDLRFVPEITEDGVLFRPAGSSNVVEEAALPSWAQSGKSKSK